MSTDDSDKQPVSGDYAPTLCPQFILLGDSITQGTSMTVQAWLQTRYSRRADIINRGFAGYTSIQALVALRNFIFPSHWAGIPPVKVLFVLLGTNDACCLSEKPDTPAVSLQGYRDALTEIITYPAFKQYGTQIVLITPPPVNEYQIPHRRLKAERTSKYAAVVRELSKQYQLPLVDCWSAFMKCAGWAGEDSSALLPGDKRTSSSDVLEALLSDGVHLTTKGYKVLYQELLQVIDTAAPSIAWKNMSVVWSLKVLGFDWENFCAADQVLNGGYPITQKDKDDIAALKGEWEASLGMSVEEFFRQAEAKTPAT